MKNLMITLTAFAAVALVTAPSADAYRIKGNGTNSTSRISVKSRFKSVRSQHNDVHQENVIDVVSDTGSNKANDNTGGSTAITSGDTTTTITIVNAGATNTMADSDDCGCDQPDSEVVIKNNGSDTENKVMLNRSTRFIRRQSNLFTSLNSLGIGSYTGDNKAEDNTGGDDGDVDVETGDTTTDIHIENIGGDNLL